MNFIITNYNDIHNICAELDKSHIVFRILNSGLQFIDLPENNHRVNEYRLHIDDIEVDSTTKIPFTKEDGKEIFNTYIQYHKVEYIIAHCVAGISRSAALIAALSMLENNTDHWVWLNDKYVPNHLVYKRILEAAGVEYAERMIGERILLRQQKEEHYV